MSGGFGLGEGARCTIRSLRAAGVRVRVHDLPLATHPNDQALPAAERPEPDQQAAVDLIHTNPNVLRQTDGLQERLKLEAPLRIGFWAWELEAFPSGWEAGFSGLDQLWCPSSFTATSLGLRSPVPVTPLPHLIDWSRADRLHRQRQVAEPRRDRPFTCLFAFDLWSTVGRKNPQGVIEAFQRAFPRRQTPGLALPEARLLLKLASGNQFPDALQQLQQRISDDPRIQLINQHLPQQAMDRLLLDADVLVHLHRAEGFGLAMAEAMGAGLPVLATGYSGNLDYMPQGSAALVRSERVTIQRGEGDYRPGWHWAEPDLEDAAAQLRQLACDDQAHCQLAVAGRRAAQQQLNPERLGAIVQQRLGCLLAQAGRAELLRALEPDHPLRRLEG
jgi:glycosyltransferase involved in cell wall biosynthesis